MRFHAGFTAQDTYIMTWDYGSHHFEIETVGRNQFEWFYCDRDADHCVDGEGDTEAMAAVTAIFLKRISRIVYETEKRI